MKLFQFIQEGLIKTGVEIDGKHFDTSEYYSTYDESFFQNSGLQKLESLVNNNSLPIAKISRFVCPIARPSKIVCIGLNYSDHANETGATIPNEPVIFLKSTTAITGPNDNIIIPKNSLKTDWEVELAVVIGKKASHVSEIAAYDYIAGYCLHNDVSERNFQLERGGTWDKGKGCDSFAPIGPYLVTKEEIADVHNLPLWLIVNGELMQNGSTSNMIFKIPQLVSYVSQFMTLLPGDVVSTGTPAGVGLGMNPPRYLKDGDVVELGILGLGNSRQEVINYSKQN